MEEEEEKGRSERNGEKGKCKQTPKKNRHEQRSPTRPKPPDTRMVRFSPAPW